MANVHAAAAMPKNFIAFEHHMVDVPWWKNIVKGLEDPLIQDGYVKVPEKPGLGIELDEANVRKHLIGGEEFFG